MIKCVIIEDEILAQKLLQKYIEKDMRLQILKVCNNGQEAFEYLSDNKIDIAFCDIQMPLLNGIDLLKIIEYKPISILTTAYENYALQGFALDVVDYLLKPFSYDRFQQAVNKAVELYQFRIEKNQEKVNEEKFIYLRANQMMQKVFLDSILYIEALKDYVQLITTDKKITIQDTMKSMEEQLPENYIRVHKSYIINKNKIEKYTSQSVIISAKEIPIGRAFKGNLKQ
ncbi:MAG: response regulator transcription factor [Saprospirales bacterium]|nr:response regulator transcription factor [Saprospirales bacterium]